MAAKKQGGKSFALELISAHPNTTGGTPEIELAVKAVRLKTLTEIGSTFNSGQVRLADIGIVDSVHQENGW
jgi:hypothetical protein